MQVEEALDESSIGNIPTPTLPKVGVRGLLYPRPYLPPMDTDTTMALKLGRTADLRPPLPRMRSQRVHLPLDGPTKPLRPTDPLALECLHHTTFRWSPHSNRGV